ncbi:MAG: tyrosine-type recombinase/integrase [Promicromonosporaceae bacterium]|nr:tyrosine-type recombinase/integrase [Promicromonosporaceae bacterium]
MPKRGNNQGDTPLQVHGAKCNGKARCGCPWRVRYTAPDGKRRSITRPTKTEAANALTAELAKSNDGTWRPPVAESDTVASYAAKWLATLPTLGRKPATVHDYTRIVETYVNRPLSSGLNLGAMKLAAVGKAVLREWRVDVVADVRARFPTRAAKSDTFGAGQAANAARVIRTMFSQAVEDELITVNPCPVKGWGVNPHGRKVAAVLWDEVPGIVDAMPPRYGAAVWVSAVAGGLRIGEVTALRRRDVVITRDADGEITGGMVTVERAAYWPQGAKEPIYGVPKTAATVRSHPLTPAVARILAGHLGMFVADGPDALLFTGERSNGPLRNDVLRTVFKRAVTRFGKPGYTFHGLRHGYASQLSDAGIPLRDIQAGGGWATLAMVNHYAKPLDHALSRISATQATLGV